MKTTRNRHSSPSKQTRRTSSQAIRWQPRFVVRSTASWSRLG